MSKYSWKFYSARRGVSLKRVVEEKSIRSYEDFVAWCSRREVAPPSEELFNEEVGDMLKAATKPKPALKEVPASPAQKAPSPTKKSAPPKKSAKSTRKSSTRSK